MAEEKKVLTLDEFEQRLMVSGLMDFRNDLLKDDKPTEDINDLILKVIDAPTKKEKRRAEREERYGSALVPFINQFPHDTKLYQLMTTRPGEGEFARGQD